MRMRVLIMSFGLASLVLITAQPVSAAPGESCASRFPETEWETVSAGSISVEATGVRSGIANRFDREIRLVEGWINDEIGPVSVTVCLVDKDSAFDVAPYVSGSQRFHARMEMDERLLILNTERFGFVGPASAYGLAHHALWQNGQSDGNPEPISSVIGHWYRARILDRLDLYHRDVMVENFFDTESVIRWTEDKQPQTLDWDPEQNFRAIGDFVDFAVASYGTDILLEADGDRWSDIEGEWRVALRVDLTGRSTPTTEWIVGIAITVVAVLLAIVAAVLGIVSKRRKKKRPPTGRAIPGFFSEG